MTCNVLPLAQNLGFRTVPFGGVSTRDTRPYIHIIYFIYVYMRICDGNATNSSKHRSEAGARAKTGASSICGCALCEYGAMKS